MKKLLKRIGKWTIIGTLPFIVGCGDALSLMAREEYENSKFKPIVRGGLDVQISRPINSVSNVPLRIRNVPIHKHDRGTPGPISHDKARVPYLVELRAIKLGLETEINKDTHLDTYVNLGLTTKNWNTGGQTRKRNYTNAPGSSQRGEGAALTYWKPEIEEEFLPSLNIDLCMHRGKKSEYVIGTGIKKYTLSIENGWDRYDNLKKYKKYPLADIIENSLYFGIQSRPNQKIIGEFKVGMNFLNVDKNSKNKDVKINYSKPSPFVSFALGIRF